MARRTKKKTTTNARAPQALRKMVALLSDDQVDVIDAWLDSLLARSPGLSN